MNASDATQQYKIQDTACILAFWPLRHLHQLLLLCLLSDFFVLTAFVLCIAFVTFAALHALSLALH